MRVALTTAPDRTTFSGAFQTGALFKLSKASVIFNVFINVALYMVFTVICFFAARPPLWLAARFNPVLAESRLVRHLPARVRRILTVKQMSKPQTVAVCFCGAAKTTSLGIPLVTAMWNAADDLTRAFIQIPVLLYTIEQVSTPKTAAVSENTCTYANAGDKRFSWRRFSCTFSNGTFGGGKRRMMRAQSMGNELLTTGAHQMRQTRLDCR